jgi:hypothetical protein
LNTDILIIKKNEVFAKVECERHVARELSEYFTFFVPGYQFVPAYRNRIWDGKIRLYNLQTSQLYLGLVPYLIEFCDEREYTYSHDLIEDEYSVYHAHKFFDTLNLHSQNKSISVREHQQNAFIEAVQKRRVLLLSPTASGKSLIIYLLFRQLLQYQQLKGLIIVPTTSLVEQLYSDFADYSTENGFNVEENVHRIYQGKDKLTDKNLTISTWQSLYKLPPEYFHQFQYVIGDEAHLFKAQSLTSILTSCVNAKYRIGLTGTLDGTKTHKLVLEGLFGPTKKVISTKELIDKKQLSAFNIKCLVLKHSEEVCKEMKDKSYPDELKYLIESENRNRFIRNLAISLDKNTLVLFQMKKHGRALYEMIKEKANERKVFFVDGDVETEVREEIRKIMEIEENAIFVASFGTTSTGTNIRNLHNIIFTSPSKSRVRNLQSIGRGLRQNEGKEMAILYDIADDLRIKKHTNFTLQHFVERVQIYNEEKFPFKIYNIGLKNGN